MGSDSPEPFTRDPFNTEVMPSTMADTVTTVMGSSQPIVTRGTADNLIPVYCSILAAVVVGLGAYIAFKRWGTEAVPWGHGRGFGWWGTGYVPNSEVTSKGGKGTRLGG